MFQYIYTSHAVFDFSEAELITLLEESKRFNQSQGITGMLVYQNRVFIQLLEGDEEAVTKLAEKISRDPRHDEFTELASMDVGQRSFPDWSMGFRRISEDQQQLPVVEGFNTVLREIWNPHEISPNPTPLVDVMKTLIRANL